MSDEIYPEERYEDERFGDLTQGDFTIAVEHAGLRELIDAIKGLSFEPPSVVYDQPAPSLAAGNRLTQSLFSELRYGLGTRDFTGAAPQQQLTSLVQLVPGSRAKYMITLKGALPADATDYDLVYLDGGPDVSDKIPLPSDDTVQIKLPDDRDAATLLAVRLRHQTEVVLVSLVTHPITASTPVGREYSE
jgi:hypothetical protein